MRLLFLENQGQNFNTCLRRGGANGINRIGKMLRAAIIEVVAVNRVITI